MGATAAVAPTFSRHETFQPRYGWLKKAVDAAIEDPSIYYRKDATVRLGVGKNMVRSIRYWGQAFKVTHEEKNPERPRVTISLPTVWGKALLEEGGWDPYLEQPGSLWLLHWLLLRPVCEAPAWWVAFHELRGLRFDDEDVRGALVDFIERQGWEAPASTSLKRDVNCVIRTYAIRPKPRDTIEDILDSPFRELNLLQPVPGEKRTYQFNYGEKATLPAEVLGFACLDYVSLRGSSSRTVTITDLAHTTGSPGRAFKVPEGSIEQALEECHHIDDRVGVSSAAGVRQMTFSDAPRTVGEDLLAAYYRRVTGVDQKLEPSYSPAIRQYMLLDVDTLRERITQASDPLDRLEMIQAKLALESEGSYQAERAAHA